jgi:cell division protein FtsA
VIDKVRQERRPRILGLIDIGSFKVCCLVVADSGARAQSDAAGALRVVGVGYQRSQGVKAGVITNLDEAEAAVRAAIAQAERMAGVTLEEVLVSVSCGRLKSQNFAASCDVQGRTVTEDDIERVLAGGRTHAERDGRTLIHMNRLGFRLDGVSGMRDPVGMAARRITADLHAVTADDAPVRNLLMVVDRCYLAAAGLVPAGLASAVAVTTEEERRLGVTCLDIGGGATTLALFGDGQFLFTDTVPVGGGHITYDIARALQTPLAEAERIKALYGTLVGAPSDEHEVISYPVAGMEDGAVSQTTKARLSAVVRLRFEQLLGLVSERLEAGGVSAHAGEHIVLTGGASQLVGAAEFAANVLGRPVRVARPHGLSGLPAAMSGPAFAVVAGLAGAAALAGSERTAFREREHLAQGYLGRVGEWLRQGF